MQDFAFALLQPQIYLLVFGTLALLVGLFAAEDGWLWHFLTPAWMGILGLILAILSQASILVINLPPLESLSVTQLQGALTIDAAGTLFGLIACAGTLLVAVMAMDFLQEHVRNQGEFYMLLLFSCCAATLVALSADLIGIYLSIEFLSITSYVLVGFDKGSRRSNEAAIKYFLFGAGCSAAMLYGMSLLFGITGEINLSAINEKLFLGQASGSALWIAIILTLTGFGFKLAAVPYHLWAPDVYEGAPTPVTAYLSIVSKAAGLAILLRFLWTSLTVTVDWVPLVAVLAIVSMTLGNLAAIPQRNVKRMLAYSSIAQVGYLLIGIAAFGADLNTWNEYSLPGVFVYLFAYLLANLGAFAAVVAVGRKVGSDDIAAYAGLIFRAPVTAFALVIFFLSLAGIPPTLGFAGKFWLFAAAVRAGTPLMLWVAVSGVANSVVSVYYYFNIARVMFFNDVPEKSSLQFHPASIAVVYICAVASVALLVFLQPLAAFASDNSWMFFVPR